MSLLSSRSQVSRWRLTGWWVQRFVPDGCAAGSPDERKRSSGSGSEASARRCLDVLPWTRSERRAPQTEPSETSPSPDASSPSPAPPNLWCLKPNVLHSIPVYTLVSFNTSMFSLPEATDSPMAFFSVSKVISSASGDWKQGTSRRNVLQTSDVCFSFIS